jgi:hypothetical protein
VKRPVDRQLRIVPGDHALALRGVDVGHLVDDLGVAGQRQEPVREAFRDPELAPVGLGQLHAHPLPAGGRAGAQVDRHVPGRAAHDADQLALGVRDGLVVQPAQHAGPGARVVVLHEGRRRRQAQGRQRGLEAGLVERFHEPASLVVEDLRLDDHDGADPRGHQAHQNTFSRRTCSR